MNYCGVLNIDKPTGLTSRDIVDRVVRLVRPSKAGHAGTLDPLATGVLVVCVGHATRLISMVQEGRKRYLGRFLLGKQSNTDDISGTLTDGGDWSLVTSEQLLSALPEFIGRIQQVPPQFSAIHVNGHRAYDLARRGLTVELSARPIDVFSIRLVSFAPPEFELEIECGSGTYVRSIGRDLGTRLGCGAVMTALRRLSVGSFDVGDAISLEQLTPETIEQHLQPTLQLVSNCSQRTLTEDEVIAVRRGQSISLTDNVLSDGLVERDVEQTLHDTRTALIDRDGVLLGMGFADSATGRIHPKIVFPIASDR